MKNDNYYEISPISSKLKPYALEEIHSILRKENNVIIDSKQKLIRYVKEAINDPNSHKNLHLGIIPKESIVKIKNEINNIRKDKINDLFKDNINYALAINQEEIRHIKKPSLTQEDIIEFIKSLDKLVTQFDSVSYTIYKKTKRFKI
ncbi:MAG: hypothetical protein IJ565_03270 [Bacilli bacterium]|nr:hypothetical protein [Bacilli bacterium]